MASGIYKRTMQRPSSANPAEEHSDNNAAAPSPGSGSGGSRDDTSQAPVGQRTLYVDRQVARRSRSRSKTKKISQLRMLIALLSVGLVFVIMGWILAWAKLQEADERATTAQADLRKMELTLVEARASAAKREQEMLSLVEKRIPDLTEIAYNALLDINDKYVLNVTFSKAGVGADKRIEYHAMLVNNSENILLPRVKIILFNEFGMQVGMVELAREHATSAVPLAELEPGETRSYHSQINMELDAAPKYFLLDIK